MLGTFTCERFTGYWGVLKRSLVEIQYKRWRDIELFHKPHDFMAKDDLCLFYSPFGNFGCLSGDCSFNKPMYHRYMSSTQLSRRLIERYKELVGNHVVGSFDRRVPDFKISSSTKRADMKKRKKIAVKYIRSILNKFLFFFSLFPLISWIPHAINS